MDRRFPAAPWPVSLKVISAAGTVMVIGISFAAYHAVPALHGFTHYFGLGVALVPPAVLTGALLFIVSGYRVQSDALRVERLVTSTSVSLSGLTRVWADSQACKGSVRVFGNGGLFSFSGWFYSSRLGRYRLFATDWRNAVVLKFSDGRAVVISPASPQSFIAHLDRIIPGLQIGPDGKGA